MTFFTLAPLDKIVEVDRYPYRYPVKLLMAHGQAAEEIEKNPKLPDLEDQVMLA